MVRFRASTVITVLWESASPIERDELEAAALRHDIELVRVPRLGLARVVLACVARGAVIVLVKDDAEASRALGLGVDEVVRSGQLTSEAIDAAIQRARARAEARVVREAFMRKTSGDDDALALRLLSRAVSHEVNNPLQALVLDVESLASGVHEVLELNEKLIERVPDSRAREALRAGPDAAHFEDILGNMRECLKRAAQAMHRFGALTFEGADNVQVGKVATELVEVLRDDVPAELTVEVSGPCRANIGRPALVCVVGAILAHALEAVRESRRFDPRVHVRVSDEEGAVLVEVEHTGLNVPADLRPSVFQPYFGKRIASTGLQGIRDRARRWGGDFLILSEPEMTTFRLIIPKIDRVGEEPAIRESVPRLRLQDYDD